MQFKSLLALQQNVIHCPLQCPYRNEAPGYYPKPPRGPQTSEVMFVFENPGSPEGRNTTCDGKPEMDYTIENIVLADALRFCEQGQRVWLFQSIGLNKATWDAAGFLIGKTIFTTDSHKCPNPAENATRMKAQARKTCLAYLREEIRLIQPRAIVAFGNHARRSIEELCGVKWSGRLKPMPNVDRLKIADDRIYAVLPHPNGLWRHPRMAHNDYEKAIESIEYVFGEVNRFLKEE